MRNEIDVLKYELSQHPKPWLEILEPPLTYGDRLESIFPLMRINSEDGTDPRVYIRGASRPMTDSELHEHFRRQILASRNYSVRDPASSKIPDN